jgi:hypothetical protein
LTPCERSVEFLLRYLEPFTDISNGTGQPWINGSSTLRKFVRGFLIVCAFSSEPSNGPEASLPKRSATPKKLITAQGLQLL